MTQASPASAKSVHAPVFADSLVYFVYNFSSKQPLDIYKTADRLLSAGLAETVASPASDEVRVAPRYLELLALWKKAHQIHEVDELLGKGDIGSVFRRHPGLGFRLARAFLRARMKRKEDGSGAEEKAEDVDEPITETIRLIEESVAHAQALNAMQQSVEQRIFRPSYLSDEPYLRLQLRDSVQWRSLLKGGRRRQAGDLEDGLVVQALLLIHRSGVMQLTIAVRLPEDLGMQEFRAQIFGSSPMFAASEIAAPFIEGAARHWGEKDDGRWLGAWSEEVHAGTRWRRMVFGSPSSVTDLFILYQAAIIDAVDVDFFDEWQCYPVVCIDEVGCCEGVEQTWLESHSTELVHLTGGMGGDVTLRNSALAALRPFEKSIVDDYSLFVSPSKAIRINWNADSEGVYFSEHLWTLLVIESTLLQYWQLRALDERLSDTRGRAFSVKDIQEQAIYGLQEFRHSTLTFGTAIDMADDMLKGWRAHKLHQRILEALNQLQQLMAAEEAKRTGRRANILASVAVVVALAFGLPAIDETLKIAAGVPDAGFAGYLAEPVKQLAEQGNAGAWKGYLLLLLVLLGACLAVIYRRSYRFRKPSEESAGVVWPLRTLEVVDDDSEDATGEGQ
ncbi:hypothetical protein [Micromonospora sp. NPDC049799]|uniref:hypothetical protein n=1 Tax=Micromonospora sp. NPDC049799 TaxID=3154741 RepID=UPI0033EB8065